MSSSQELSIKIKVDFDDEEKHKIVERAIKQAAKTLLTTCMLLKDRRDPQVSIWTENHFISCWEIELFGEDDEDGN